MNTTDFEEEGYKFVHEIGDHGHCGIYKFLYTYAIVSGLNQTGYEDRWCYKTLWEATSAYVNWIAEPEAKEPEGWHRHPTTGRRRPDGNKEQEYISR